MFFHFISKHLWTPSCCFLVCMRNLISHHRLTSRMLEELRRPKPFPIQCTFVSSLITTAWQWWGDFCEYFFYMFGIHKWTHILKQCFLLLISKNQIQIPHQFHFVHPAILNQKDQKLLEFLLVDFGF